MNDPLVSINILSYNRKDDLRVTLGKVYEQNYKNIEVIVVDNASLDGSAAMVKEEYPSVHLIALNENIGIAGWNNGFMAAMGTYVLMLDDDSYPDVHAISNGVKFLLENDQYGIVAYTIMNPSDRSIEIFWVKDKTPLYFIGCGALIKNEVLVECGLFSELLFLYEHEIEFSMRVLQKGYRIKHSTDDIVFHKRSRSNRQLSDNMIDTRRQYYVCRNIIITILLHFSIIRSSANMILIILNRLYLGLRYGFLWAAVKGFWSVVEAIPKICIRRELIDDSLQKQYGYGRYAGIFLKKEYL